MNSFYQVLINTLIANVTTSYLWFALTFWVFLETRSVLATGIIGGIYMLLVAIFSVFFGTVVDHYKKKNVMVASTLLTLLFFSVAGTIFYYFDVSRLLDWTSSIFWLFAGFLLIGAVIENMRNIALSTTVTLLVPKENRDKANGMVGAVQGVAFMITSVFSGLSIGLLGMGWTLAIAIMFISLAAIHILFVKIPEDEIYHDPALKGKQIDFKGSVAAIRAVPGLVWLIAFTTFNNLVGGVFMVLMDPYGLTLFPVEIWGVVLGVTSIGFIVGGTVVAKKGLGNNPLKTLLRVNIAIAILGMIFTIREMWLLYVVGIFIFMCLMPAAEAAEQTIIQRVVPYKRQGRVFGLAQAVEAASSPLTAFIIAPAAQFVIIPYMKSETGEQTFGWLLGDGEARGISLVFVIASLVMLIATIVAFKTRAYRLLSDSYRDA